MPINIHMRRELLLPQIQYKLETSRRITIFKIQDIKLHTKKIQIESGKSGEWIRDSAVFVWNQRITIKKKQLSIQQQNSQTWRNIIINENGCTDLECAFSYMASHKLPPVFRAIVVLRDCR